MTLAELSVIAEATVAATQRKLPPTLRSLALAVPVISHDSPSDDILGDEFEPDILGMFVGPPHGEPTGDSSEPPPQILLFIWNLWEYSEEDPATFRDEVKLTYLHELGHYFGWDEDEVAARGLD
jgi:predicted Zn-dependent protease with MMP-like domain